MQHNLQHYTTIIQPLYTDRTAVQHQCYQRLVKHPNHYPLCSASDPIYTRIPCDYFRQSFHIQSNNHVDSILARRHPNKSPHHHIVRKLLLMNCYVRTVTLNQFHEAAQYIGCVTINVVIHELKTTYKVTSGTKITGLFKNVFVVNDFIITHMADIKKRCDTLQLSVL